MNKAINITINNQIFYIEEKAYEELDKYLESIKSHFSSFEDKDEIIEDIESRIAEKLSTRISSKKEVITQRDINNIIKSMGTVSDFAEFESDDSLATHENNHNRRQEENSFRQTGNKLYRDMDNAMLAGVSSGIASYFGIDPIVIRLLFVLTLFVGGTGVIIYIILWVVMPEAKTTAQKLEMRGDNVTLQKIEKEIKDKVQNIDTEKISKVAQETAQGAIKKSENFAKKLGGFLNELCRGARPFASGIFRIIFMFIGIILIFSGVVALIAVGFSVVAILFNLGSSFINFPISEIFPGTLRYVASISLFFVAGIPLILLVMIGSSLARARSTFNLPISVTLISVWVISLMTAGVIALERGPEIQDKVQEIEMTYSEDSETRDLENFRDFESIDVSGAYKVNIIQAEDFAVKISGIDREIENAKISVDNNKLNIERKDDFGLCFFCSVMSVTIDIEMPELNEIDLSGASKAKIQGFDNESFVSKLSGASRLEIESNFESVDLDLSGASRIDISGKGSNINAKLSGASKLYADNFIVQNADINASGASRIELNVLDDLKADISGASNIYYKGGASILDIQTSGSSKVEKR